MGIHAPRPRVAARRHPAAGPMRAFPVKLPLAAHARLHLQAERLHCYPSALARALVLQGLDQLDGEVA